jgi:Fic/DOC family
LPSRITGVGIGDVRTECGGGPVADIGPCRLSQWPGFYPQLDAHPSEQGGGTGCHAQASSICCAERNIPAVRVTLGHFIFVYIHPYIDGNGRMGRFLMNMMMIAAGYRWTVIPLSERKTYVAALEKASVEENIGPFAAFLARLVRDRLTGSPSPITPSS